MKDLFIIVFFFGMSLFCTAQDHNDWILQKKGDTIHCSIKSIGDHNIYYSYKKRKTIKSGFISKEDILDFYLFKESTLSMFSFDCSPKLEHKRSYYGQHHSITGTTNKVITIYGEGYKTYIETFDVNTMKVIKTEKYDHEPPKSYLIKTYQLNNRLYCFYLRKKNKTISIYCREVDFERGTFKSIAKEIITIQGPVSSLDWKISASKDGSTMLIMLEKFMLGSGFKVKSPKLLYAFNFEMKQLFQKEIIFPFVDRKMELFDFAIDNNGNVFMLVEATQDSETIYEFIKISKNSSTLKRTNIPLKKGKFINEIWLREINKGEFICSGFYNRGKYRQDCDGIFMTKISSDGEFSDINFYEIPLKILNQYERKPVKNKNKRLEAVGEAEFGFMKLQKVFQQDDGSIILIGEEHRESSSNYMTSDGAVGTITITSYNDILITKLDQKGRLIWMKKLPKLQTGGSAPGDMSFKYIKIKNDHCFVYLDNIKNKNLPLNQCPARYHEDQGGSLMLYRVSDQDGEIKKIPILNTFDVGGYKLKGHCTDCIHKISSNDLLLDFYLKRKKKIKLKLHIN